MSVTILAQTEDERQAFLQALQGHVPGLVELGDFSAAPRLTLADTVQVVVIEHRVPDIDGLALVDWLQQRRPRLPLVLVVTGGDPPFAVQAIRRGLADYVPREHLDWLGPVVREWVLAPWNLCRPHRHLEELGLLVGPTIHELNNIFTPLQLGIDLLHNPLNPEHREKLIQTLTQSMQRGSDLIGQVLEHERLRWEDCSWVSLDELTQRLVEERHTSARPIYFSAEANLPPLWGDAVQLHHLVRLGLQWMQHQRESLQADASQAPLRLQLRHQTKSSPAAEKNPFGQIVRSWLELAYSIPYSREERPVVKQLPSPLDPLSVHSGFDLLMIRGIIRRHFGRLDVAELPNEGITLTIWLPVTQPGEAESGRDSAS
ncbi:MAG: hypothetical protein SNJ75_03085 [Gemmataceae bacterium]